MAAAKKKVHVQISPFDDYAECVAEIVAAILAKVDDGEIAQPASRERAAIRQEVDRWLTKMNPKLPKNRFDVVCRAVAVGVTKTLEGWEYTALNRAWPPEEC